MSTEYENEKNPEWGEGMNQAVGAAEPKMADAEVTPDETAAGAAENGSAAGTAETVSSETTPVEGETAGAAEPEAADAEVTPGVAAPETADAEVIPDETLAGAAAPAPVQPKKKPKKWIIPVAVAAVVAVATGAFALSSRKDPKDVVIDAFKSITAEGQTDPAEELFGIKAMTEKLAKESSQGTFELTMEGSSNETASQLATAKIGFSVLNDVGNKKSSLEMNVGYANMDLARLLLYADETQLAAAIPELSGKVFTLNYADDLEGQLASSPYFGTLLEASGIDASEFGAYITKCQELSAGDGGQVELFDIKALWDRYREGSKAIDDLKAAMTVEKGEKKNFSIDGADVSCDGYQVTVAEDALIQFAYTTKDFILKDETLKNDFVTYLDLISELPGAMASLTDGAADMELSELQEKLWEETDKGIDQMIEQMQDFLGDVTMDVYVTKDGKMAGFDYETTATVGEEELRLFGDVVFAGGYNMMSNVAATLHVEDGKGQTVTLSLEKTGSYEADTSLNRGMTGSIEAEGMKYSLAYESDYQAEDGSYRVSLDFLSGDESQFSIRSDGFVGDLVKGESMEVYMDSIRLESPVLTGSSQYIEFSGKYSMGPLTDAVELPEGESFDVLAAAEADYEAVAAEISGNVFGLLLQLMQ